MTREYPGALSDELISQRESDCMNNDQEYFNDYDDSIRPAIISASLARDMAYVTRKVQETDKVSRRESSS